MPRQCTALRTAPRSLNKATVKAVMGPGRQRTAVVGTTEEGEAEDKREANRRRPGPSRPRRAPAAE